VVKINIKPPRPLKVDAGKYIYLRIRISSFSILQSHPFMVTSWSEEEQHSLSLFIESHGGLTNELLRRSKADGDGHSSYFALFSGPHGISAPVGDYETILMIAEGSGIATHLPYLKKLIYGYNSCKTRTRRIRVVWQLQTSGKQIESLKKEM
jgi:NAD(P)H-flavin reductase